MKHGLDKNKTYSNNIDNNLIDRESIKRDRHFSCDEITVTTFFTR